VTVRRGPAVLAGLVVAVAGAGCGGDDSRAPAPTPTPKLQAELSKPVHLLGTYSLEGHRRRVDVQIGFDNLTDPYRSATTAPSRGIRLVAVHLQVLNHGRDPFPLDWARFRGYDQRGRALPAGTESTPVRKTVADRPVRGQVLTSVAAFRVPRGSRLGSIRMYSIVDLWRFKARWQLTP
jgi:hypothetical protein